MSKNTILHAMAVVLALPLFAGSEEPVIVRADVASQTQAPLSREPAVETQLAVTAPVHVVPAPRYRREVVEGGILCWNEANDRLNDCAAIITMRMRSARFHRRTFAEELYYLHGDGRAKAPDHAALRSDRATNPQPHDSRPWLGEVTSDLHQPSTWPGTPEEWDERARRLEALFQYVERILDGEVRDPCQGRSRRWGGPSVDKEDIAQHLARGEEILECGDTMNVFLGRR
jgi:hypothetical protein